MCIPFDFPPHPLLSSHFHISEGRGHFGTLLWSQSTWHSDPTLKGTSTYCFQCLSSLKLVLETNVLPEQAREYPHLYPLWVSLYSPSPMSPFLLRVRFESAFCEALHLQNHEFVLSHKVLKRLTVHQTKPWGPPSKPGPLQVLFRPPPSSVLGPSAVRAPSVRPGHEIKFGLTHLKITSGCCLHNSRAAPSLPLLLAGCMARVPCCIALPQPFSLPILLFASLEKWLDESSQ